MNGVIIIPTKIVTEKPLIVGAFQIVAVWWGHQPGQTAVVGVLTDQLQNGSDNLECASHICLLENF